MSVRQQILNFVGERPGITDRELADLILGKDVHPSPVNQACRHLVDSGHLARQPRTDGRIGNYPTGMPPPPTPEAPVTASDCNVTDELTEDQIKLLLRTWLETQGWRTEIAWGRKPGIDVVARRGDEIWIIEAKGCGSLQAMRVNYFIAMLGELLQRMSIEEASHSIALPNMQQYRRLWERLPELARRRTGITALFVSVDGKVEHITN